MRYFERKRRASIKEHYVSGAPKSVSGNGSVEIISSSGVPFKSLKISGKTKQISNQTTKHYDYFTNLDNYAAGDIGYTYIIPFPDEWLGKELTFSLIEKTRINDIFLDLTDGTSFFANASERLLDNRGNISTVTSDKYTHFRISAILEKTKISEFWNSYILCVEGKSEDFPIIQPSPDLPQPIINAGEGGTSLEINGKKLTIPSSIDINGATVPLLLSEYDVLIVDGVNKTVKYEMSTFQYSFTGEETFSLSMWATGKGYGNYYQTIPPNGPRLESVLACSHFTKGKWTESAIMKTQANCFGHANTWYIWFKTDGVQTVDEFTAWLKAQNEQGTPVTVVAKRQVAKEYDLSGTDLGQALLSFCMPIGESGTLEVKGALEEIPIELTYYSSEVEDVANITIKYINQNGDDICEPRVEQVRQGSKYLIVAPHIDGYKRVSTEVFGVADGDTEIILEYKEE